MAGKGVDVGTAFLVGAQISKVPVEGDESAEEPKFEEKVQYRKVRNAFLEIEKTELTESMLKKSKVSFVEGKKENVYVLGDASLNMASFFKDSKLRRPLAKGVLAQGEQEAVNILNTLLKEVLGDPEEENEVCYYSVPADAVDSGQDNVYHSAQIGKIISDLGYDARPLNEANAIIYSQCESSGFSGLAVSFGAGMANAFLAYRSMEVMRLATSRGGDWIDEKAAAALGMAVPRITKAKEKDWDIRTPKDRVQEALAEYYKKLIQYTVDHIEEALIEHDIYGFDGDVPVVLAGGTSMVGGFAEVFEEELKARSLEMEFSEVRRVEKPLTTVAHGLLIAAKSV